MLLFVFFSLILKKICIYQQNNVGILFWSKGSAFCGIQVVALRSRVWQKPHILIILKLMKWIVIFLVLLIYFETGLVYCKID